MKHTHVIPSLLFSLLLVSSGVAQTPAAQTSDRQNTSDLRDNDAIAAARSQYAQNGSVSHDAKDSDTNRADATDLKNQAQLSQRGPGLPYPRRTGYPRGGYPGMWQPEFNGRHAAIGAAIGFGLGAAVGAKGNTDQHVQARIAAPLLFGSVGALFGAVIGAGAPGRSSWGFRRRRPWPYGDEDESGSGPEAHHADQQASSQPAPAKALPDQAAASLEPPENAQIGRFVKADRLNASETHLNERGSRGGYRW
jgi:hypothetical protein